MRLLPPSVGRSLLLLFFALTLLATACVSISVPVPDRVVVDTIENIRDGAFISWKLDPGTYRIETTATGDGTTIQWVGAACPSSTAAQTASVTCQLPATGQVTVTNPTTFGLGASSNVTVKITRLGR